MQDSSAPNQLIPILPNQSRSLDMILECEQIPQSSELEVIELGELKLTSLGDPVIDLKGQLSNRTVTVIIIGRLQSPEDIDPIMQTNPHAWSSLKLLPSQWLNGTSNEHTMLMKTSNKANSSVPTGKLDNRSALDVTGQKPNRWTYQKLVEIPSIAEQHYIHWCILIDNSGSMSIHRNAIYESLVVLMESLRKLESTFAVARFGSRNNQKILKNLHELFTNQDGEYVLQALTFDEGTYPATGLARVAETVFPSNQPNPPPHTVIHRLVLMITDGLTDENKEASYSKTI
ncbi:unnamed protein product, partial [Rotaria sp. Silwood1]